MNMLPFFNVRNKSTTFEKYFVRYPLLSMHYLLALQLILSTIITKVVRFPVNTSFLCGQNQLIIKISIFIWSQMCFSLIQIPTIFEVLMCWFWSTLNIKCGVNTKTINWWHFKAKQRTIYCFSVFFTEFWLSLLCHTIWLNTVIS